MEEIYKVLADLSIKYEKYDHPAVFTSEEADKYFDVPGVAKSKNLFLRNKKGNRHILVVITDRKKTDLKKLAEYLGESKLSFASAERLMKYLGLTPGSVSPFGLINDSEKSVEVIVDTDLTDMNKVSFHPNINTSTLVISSEDFRRFLDSRGNSVTFLQL